MDFADFFDLRMLVVIAASSLWMPFAKLIWRAVNPYPHLFTDKLMRREGPQIELPLVSEEWAEIRKQRNAKTPATSRSETRLRKLTDGAADSAGGAKPHPTRPVRRGFRPVLRHLEGESPSEQTLRRA